MRFDITLLDKTLLIQTLFAFSDPAGLGKEEYKFRKLQGDNVDGLTDQECEEILCPVTDTDYRNIRIIDYLKGKPIKLNFHKTGNGRILVDSMSYDERNGKYRFFEALLNIFPVEEIYITRKTYPAYSFINIPENLLRTKEQLNEFKTLISNLIPKEGQYGRYSVIDEMKTEYISPLIIEILKNN